MRTKWHSLFWPRWKEADQLFHLKSFLNTYRDSCNIIIKLHHCCPTAIRDEAKSLVHDYGCIWVEDVVEKISDPFPFMHISDCLISDLSGIIPEFIWLGKPVIFIEPDQDDIWTDSSIPSEMRPGPVVTDFKDLLLQVQQCIDNPLSFFKKEREQFLIDFFSFTDNKSAIRAKRAILDKYSEYISH